MSPGCIIRLRLVRARAGGHKGEVPLTRLLNLALPPRCPGCGAIVEAPDRFCAACWGRLRFLGPPWCATCHAPFDTDREEGAQCGACLSTPPQHAGVSAAVAYGDVARTVALRLKYQRRTAYAVTMARLMQRHLPADADLLLPVPLHRWRLWTRGYNQAGLIAAALSRGSGVKSAMDLLRRRRATPVLRGRNPRERRQAVAGAFAVAPGAADRLRGRHVVLVDDVYTSGATTDACIAVLRRAGVARVTVLAWARVIVDAQDA